MLAVTVSLMVSPACEHHIFSFFCWRLSPPVESHPRRSEPGEWGELRLSRTCFHWFSTEWWWDWRVESRQVREQSISQWWSSTCQGPVGARARASCRERMVRPLPRRMWVLERQRERGQWWFLFISCVAALSTHCEEREQIESQDDYDTMGRSFLRHKQSAAGRGTGETRARH